jgi:hypothetical protein
MKFFIDRNADVACTASQVVLAYGAESDRSFGIPGEV